MIEEFHDFVAERMAEPIMGITDLYAKITPQTERARLEKIMNIKLGGGSVTRRGTLRRFSKLDTLNKNRVSIYRRQETTNRTPGGRASIFLRQESKTPCGSVPLSVRKNQETIKKVKMQQ